MLLCMSYEFHEEYSPSGCVGLLKELANLYKLFFFLVETGYGRINSNKCPSIPQDSCVQYSEKRRQLGRQKCPWPSDAPPVDGLLIYRLLRSYNPASSSRGQFKNQSHGHCSSNRRRCPTSVARSWARRPHRSWGSSRRQTRGERRATRPPWWARRPAMLLLMMSQSQPCPGWWCAGASRLARRRAAVVARAAGAWGRRGGRPQRAGGARTQPVALVVAAGARDPVGRLRSRGARRGWRSLVIVTVPLLVGTLMVLGGRLLCRLRRGSRATGRGGSKALCCCCYYFWCRWV